MYSRLHVLASCYRNSLLVPLALVVGLATTASAQPAWPPSNTPFELGVNYHATTADFNQSAFIKTYHTPAVRATVRAQLQAMASDGADVIKTTLWQVGGGAESWRLSFPLANQELVNLRAFAADVAATTRPDGRFLTLQLTLAWLGCADYTVGAPSTTVGICDLTWDTFLSRARTSVSALIHHVADILRPDGRQVVSLIYLDLEVMVGAKANQDRFLLDLYPFFLARTGEAGIEGSIYFLVPPAEAQILDDGYVDTEHPVLSGHLSMFWLYRSVFFLTSSGLPVPRRLDFSFYPERQWAAYAQLVNRVFDDFEVVFPSTPAGVAETHYFLDARRAELGQAFAASYLTRGLPESVIFWTTPAVGGTTGVEPPFDFGAYALQVPPGASTIAATPNPCLVPVGQPTCQAVVTWSTTAQSATAAAWVEWSGGGPPVLVGCGKTGLATIPGLPVGATYVMTLHATPWCDERSTTKTGIAVASIVYDVAAVPATSLVLNGDFSGGLSGWEVLAQPDPGDVTWTIGDGVLEFRRLPPAAGTANQAFVRQVTGTAVTQGAGLTARFDLGNTSTARRRISVLLVDADFSDVAVCTFWLPPGAPLRRFEMRGHATAPWANAAIYFYAATAEQGAGAYRIDNVVLTPNVGTTPAETECTDPLAPTAGTSPAGPELLVNGGFEAGLTSWVVNGPLEHVLANGALELRHAPQASATGSLLQTTGTSVAANDILTAELALASGSNTRERVTILLHDADFHDLAACSFWLAPGQSLARYEMRTYAPTGWSNVTVAIYPTRTASGAWLTLDNVSVRRTPAALTSGTSCVAGP